MKKTISMLLLLALTLCSVLAVSSCTADTPPEIPEGYKLYENSDLSFAYPEDWSMQSGSVVMLINPAGVGNNINVVYENKTDAYDDLTVESFNESLKPAYEAMGMRISNVAVSHETTNNVNYTKLSYSATVSGTKMKQTALIATIGNYTYSITITETNADAELVETVINTLYSKR